MKIQKYLPILFLSMSLSIFAIGCAEEVVKEEAVEDTVQDVSFPLPEDFLLIEESTEDSGHWAKYESDLKKEEVQKNYQDLLKESEWDITTVGALGGKYTLAAETETQTLDILISEEGEKSMVEITLIQK